MCIIVAKPMNAEMPDEGTLRRCFDSNPDGAGFMWADGKAVRIRKGFMRFADFMEALDEEIPEAVRGESAVVMHFRIETSGGVNPRCCHPFPISDEPDDLKATRIESRFGIAHNGVISGRRTGKDWSDTMDFVSGIAYPLMRMNPGFMHNSYALELLEDACGSKLAILDNSGDLATVGQFVEDGGVLYSNTSYLTKVSSWSYYGSLFDDERMADAYGDDYAPWDDVDKLIEHLPYESCALCPMNEECAYSYPECENEQMAMEASEYYESVLAEENERQLVLL